VLLRLPVHYVSYDGRFSDGKANWWNGRNEEMELGLKNKKAT
jgi:hypothetical protein